MGLYYAAGSRRNVVSHLRQFSYFCVAFNQPFLPATRYGLLGFIELMSRTCGYDHLQHVLASIKFLHDFKGLHYEGDSFEFTVLLKGMQRKLSRSVKQALPITPEILLLMYEFVDLNDPDQLAHWTAFLFCLRLLYRKSSIAPESLTKFNPTTGLSREKAIISDGVILVFQNFSKTNQFMATNRVVPLVPGNEQKLDPVYHYKKLISENVLWQK